MAKNAAANALPRIQPILPRIKKQPFDDPDYLFQLKYDGFRGVLYIEEERRRIVSKSGRMLNRFTDLANAVAAELKVKDAILDGEVIVKDETGKPDFKMILRQKGAPLYIPFDLLWLAGEDLRRKPLWERRKLLHAIMPKKPKALETPVEIEGEGKRIFELVRAHDLEGIVAKRLEGIYVARFSGWQKIKNPDYTQVVGRKEFFDKVREKT